MSTTEFNNAIAHHSIFLRGFALKFTKNSEDARDLIQDTVLKALRYRDNFIDGTNLRGWLYTIMRNIFINNYKRKASQRTFLDKTDEGFFINAPQDSGFDSISVTMNCADIRKAIDRLSDDFKAPFLLFTEGYRYEEIADRIGKPVGTVKSRIHHARQRLMSELPEFAGTSDRRGLITAG